MVWILLLNLSDSQVLSYCIFYTFFVSWFLYLKSWRECTATVQMYSQRFPIFLSYIYNILFFSVFHLFPLRMSVHPRHQEHQYSSPLTLFAIIDCTNQTALKHKVARSVDKLLSGIFFLCALIVVGSMLGCRIRYQDYTSHSPCKSILRTLMHVWAFSTMLKHLFHVNLYYWVWTTIYVAMYSVATTMHLVRTLYQIKLFIKS